MIGPLELLFRQGNQVLFMPQVLLKLGDLEFIVPVNVTLGLRKKIVITEIFGADFSVKEDFGLCDFRINIEGTIGNVDSGVGAKICGINKKVNALDFIARLVKLTALRGPLEISDVSQDYATNILGTAARRIDQAFDLPFGGPTEPEGILNKLGIFKVVIMGLDVHPAKAGHYRFYLELMSEIAEDEITETDNINLFLKEEA